MSSIEKEEEVEKAYNLGLEALKVALSMNPHNEDLIEQLEAMEAEEEHAFHEHHEKEDEEEDEEEEEEDGDEEENHKK